MESGFDCPPLPFGLRPSGRGGRPKKFSGGMALDSNPVAESAMQAEHPHRKFFRLDSVRDELSPPATTSFASPDPASRPGSSTSTAPSDCIRSLGKRHPCRRIAGTSAEARLSPEKSLQKLNS